MSTLIDLPEFDSLEGAGTPLEQFQRLGDGYLRYAGSQRIWEQQRELVTQVIFDLIPTEMRDADRRMVDAFKVTAIAEETFDAVMTGGFDLYTAPPWLTALFKCYLLYLES